MNSPIKVAIVDDQTLFREGMVLVLNSFQELEVVLETNSGPKLIDQFPVVQPDIILLDYTMPEMDGFEVLQRLRAINPEVKVIILTMHFDESLMVFLMQHGANGYLLKDEPSSVVRDAILEVNKAGLYFPNYVSTALLKQMKQLSGKQQAAKPHNPFAKQSFSKREKEILAIVGKYSRQELAKQLFVSIKTIDFHLKNLRDKTESSSTSELVHFAIKNGYQD